MSDVMWSVTERGRFVSDALLSAAEQAPDELDWGDLLTVLGVSVLLVGLVLFVTWMVTK